MTDNLGLFGYTYRLLDSDYTFVLFIMATYSGCWRMGPKLPWVGGSGVIVGESVEDQNHTGNRQLALMMNNLHKICTTTGRSLLVSACGCSQQVRLRQRATILR